MAAGNFDTFVSVVSRDEFSRIAQHTNERIMGLRDKERIKRSFGNYLSPIIANSILSSEEETNLGGREVEVAVLFTDLRDFAPCLEKCTLQELLEILNECFPLVVNQVHGYHGVLGKFIGDEAMAVFGLDATDHNLYDNVLERGLAIREGLETLNEKPTGCDLTPLRNGIGISLRGYSSGEHRIGRTA